MRLAIFASGSGSNFQAIVDEVTAGNIPATVDLLVCDRPSAHVVQRAEAMDVPTLVLRPKDFPSRESYEKNILEQLTSRHIDLIVLAGYMRLLTNVLVESYAERIVNIHPALLPAFPGLDGIGDALAYGVKVTGVTVHFVDMGMDTGPIIAQEAVPVLPDDDRESLANRVHQVEHALYPEVIRWIAEGRVKLEGRHVEIK